MNTLMPLFLSKPIHPINPLIPKSLSMAVSFINPKS